MSETRWLPGGQEKHKKHLDDFADMYTLIDEVRQVGFPEAAAALKFALLGAQYGIKRCCIQHFIRAVALGTEQPGPMRDGVRLCKKCRSV